MTVEEFALSHYASSGWNGFHTEVRYGVKGQGRGLNFSSKIIGRNLGCTVCPVDVGDNFC